MYKFEKIFAKYYVIVSFAIIIIGLIAGAIWVLSGSDVKISEYLSYLAVLLSSMGVFVAVSHFTITHNYHRKVHTLEIVMNVRETLQSDAKILNEKINFSSFGSLEVIELATILGMASTQNNSKAGYGIDNSVFESDTISVTISFLNTLELLAHGLENSTLDEEMIEVFYSGTMIKAANNFRQFIQHINSMHPQSGGKIYMYLTAYSYRISSQYGIEQ